MTPVGKPPRFALAWDLARHGSTTGDAPRKVSRRSPLGRLAATAIGLEILLGIGAIGGGLALMLGPHGEILPLPV